MVEPSIWASKKFALVIGCIALVTGLLILKFLSEASYVTLFQFITVGYLAAQGAVDTFRRS